MRNNYYSLVGQRLKIIRELLLLKVNEVKILTGISPTTLRRAEYGSPTTIIKIIDLLSNLYNISKDTILDIRSPIPNWTTLKKNILNRTNNDIFLIKCIEKRPSQRKAIQFRAMQSTYLNDYKSVSELQLHIENRYKWTYSYEDILMSASSLVDEGFLELDPDNVSPKKFRKTRKKTNDILSESSVIIIKLEELFAATSNNSVTPAFERMASMLLILKDEATARSVLYKKVNYVNAHKNHIKSLKILEDLHLVERTESKANSRNQKYRLAEKGIMLLREWGINL